MGIPLISILTRLGSEGSNYFTDLKLCLEAQSSNDFEWIIVCRPGVAISSIEALFQCREGLSDITRFKILEATVDNRSALLNLAFTHATGDLVVVVDDDDLVTSIFVETFENAGRTSGYLKVVRANTQLMECQATKLAGVQFLQQVSKISRPWNDSFDLERLLQVNQTPCMSLAFPRRILEEANIRWDEELTVVEDWDFALRTTQFIEVIQVDQEIGIYRKGVRGFRSKTEIPKKVWRSDEIKVRSRAYRERGIAISPVEKFKMSFFNYSIAQNSYTFLLDKIPSFTRKTILESLFLYKSYRRFKGIIK